jgi:SM-20-related protein
LEERFENLIVQLLANGYGVVDNFMSELEVANLNVLFKKRYDNHEFKNAGISKTANLDKSIRGDEILWIENTSIENSEILLLGQINEFMIYVNKTCYLGLKSAEIHFASYPIGSFYKKHFDKFKIDSDRKLSVVFYLNNNWVVANGGELILYIGNTIKTILPVGGRMVVFESDKIEHEVLPSNKIRNSITGWLKTN